MAGMLSLFTENGLGLTRRRMVRGVVGLFALSAVAALTSACGIVRDANGNIAGIKTVEESSATIMVNGQPVPAMCSDMPVDKNAPFPKYYRPCSDTYNAIHCTISYQNGDRKSFIVPQFSPQQRAELEQQTLMERQMVALGSCPGSLNRAKQLDGMINQGGIGRQDLMDPVSPIWGSRTAPTYTFPAPSMPWAK